LFSKGREAESQENKEKKEIVKNHIYIYNIYRIGMSIHTYKRRIELILFKGYFSPSSSVADS
jgi:hypothetical protein